MPDQPDPLEVAKRALAEYANEAYWHDDEWGIQSVYHGPNGGGYSDPARRARNALKKIERLTRA